MMVGKRSRSIIVAALLFVAAMSAGVVAGPEEAPFATAPKHIVMIMLDGFRPDYITMYGPPTLSKLAAEGTWVADASAVFPPVTSPNQASFVTGAWPASTRIPNNSVYDRETDTIRSTLRNIQVRTIAEIMRDAGWSTAAVGQFMVQNRGATRYQGGNIDALIATFIMHPPGLSFYYNAHPDAVGHQTGPFSEEMRTEVLRTDAEIGRFLDFLQSQGLLEQTAIVIASDHGMSLSDDEPISPTLDEIFASLDLRVATDAASLRPDTDLVYLKAGSGLLYWREHRYDAQKEAALLAKLAQIDGADILTGDQLRALGAEPYDVGDIVVVPHKGRALNRGSGRSGLHGRPTEQQNTILFWGAGIQSGHVVPRANIVDVVPTLLALAALPVPPTVDGTIVHEALARPAWKSDVGQAGDVIVTDIAASSYHPLYPPSFAVDGQIDTFWISDPGQDSTRPLYVALNLGAKATFSALEITSRNFANAVGPRDVIVQISDDNETYIDVYTGTLPAVRLGDKAVIDLQQPAHARYVRLIVESSHGGPAVQIAELALIRSQ